MTRITQRLSDVAIKKQVTRRVAFALQLLENPMENNWSKNQTLSETLIQQYRTRYRSSRAIEIFENDNKMHICFVWLAFVSQ